MNVWIFVITALLAPQADALLAPIAEPLGLSTQQVAPATMAAPIDVEPRFHGIERMLAELEAGQR